MLCVEESRGLGGCEDSFGEDMVNIDEIVRCLNKGIGREII